MWGFVNMLHSQVQRLDRAVDRIVPEMSTAIWRSFLPSLSPSITFTSARSSAPPDSGPVRGAGRPVTFQKSIVRACPGRVVVLAGAQTKLRA